MLHGFLDTGNSRSNRDSGNDNTDHKPEAGIRWKSKHFRDTTGNIHECLCNRTSHTGTDGK